MTESTDTIEQRVETLLNQLTLREKVSLLSGEDDWHTVATSFPTGVSMAASWDPALIERVAEALAEETRALGCDILLGPCVNIVRTPLAGRNGCV